MSTSTWVCPHRPTQQAIPSVGQQRARRLERDGACAPQPDKGEVPADCRNATIHETFVAKFQPPPVPKTAGEWAGLKETWLAALRSQVVRGWPSDEEAGPLAVELIEEKTRDKVRLRVYEFRSQPTQSWLYSRLKNLRR